MKPKPKKSLFDRWRYYKNSGPLTFFPIIAVIVIVAVTSYTQLEFFDKFSCQGLIEYVTVDRDLGEGIPLHHELTPEQHDHLHEIIEPCLVGSFSDVVP